MGVPCHSLGLPLWSWESPPPRVTLPPVPALLTGLWGPGESQREVSLGGLLGEPDLPGAGLHELHSLPALHRGQREMSPLVPRQGPALSLYIVYIETVIYISACLKYCINVNLPSEGRGDGSAPAAASAACVGVRVCAHVTLPLSSLLHPYSKKNPPKLRQSLDGWRGALDLGWQRRIPSAPPSLPRAPHPHVPVLFGGCSWFSRRLSHSSDPNRPWGSRRCWDSPGEHFVSS